MRSSTDSRPTDRRIDIVAGARRGPLSSVSWRWVVEAGWMMRLRVSPTLARCDHRFDPLHQPDAGLEAAREPEREHRSGARGRYSLASAWDWALEQPGVRHPGDRRMRLEIARHRERVRAVALHAQRQGLDARSGC